jgi:probable rRNA maturation factor
VDPGSKRLRVIVTDGTGRPVRDGGLGAWLAAIAPARATGEVGVALVSDGEVRVLNRRYRRKNQPTDVLAFSTNPGPRPTSYDTRSGLGDIAIATGVARRQAKAAGHSLQAELRVLALHGLLHLLGYDHGDPRARVRMARVEVRLRQRGGLDSALLERAGRAPAARRTRT